MSDRVRCAVIGTGYFAQDCHIPGLQRHPRAEVTLVCGRNRERTQAVAGRFAVPAWTTDWEAAISDKNIDAVTIAYPDHLHVPIAAAALRAGKHVFCEKPLGRSAEETADLLGQARQSDRIRMVAFTLRYLLATRKLREEVAGGRLGRLRFVRAQSAAWTAWTDSTQLDWRLRWDRGGTGVSGDVGCHLFDLLTWIIGRIEGLTGLSVTLENVGRDPEGEGRLASDTDEIDAALVRVAGLPGQIFLSRRATQGTEGAWFEVVGDEGGLRAALTRGQTEELVFQKLDGSVEQYALPSEGETFPLPARGRMMKAFVDAVLRGAPDPELDGTFVEGHRAQVALDALHRSAREQRWVEVPSVL